MVVRLLKKRFERDPAMRARLVVAMPIGGHVTVARGQRTGGTFDTLPLCSAPDESGCVVAFRTHRFGRVAEGVDAIGGGEEEACVSPLDEATNRRATFSRPMVPVP